MPARPFIQKSFGELFPQRAYAGFVNRALFTTVTDFQASESVDMTLASTDPLGVIGRGQAAVIKRIEAGVFLPLCVPTGSMPPPFQPSDIYRSLFHTYTFMFGINGPFLSYPVAFTSNGDSRVSENYWANYEKAIQSLTCSVKREFIDPANQGIGFNVYLYFLVELYPYAPGPTA